MTRTGATICRLLLFLIAVVRLCANGEELTDRPIIGMLAMKITDEVILKEKPDLEGKSYFGASYVKLVQSAGGRVVPIVDDPRTYKKLDTMFSKLNGIMLPGGGNSLIDSEYSKMANRVFQKSIDINKNGTHFPVFGICRGFQAMPVLTHGSTKILKLFNSKNVSLQMKIPDNYKQSKMLKDLPADLKNLMETKNITPHFHKYGIYPSEMKNSKKLSEEYRILGTSIDRNGQPFVSAYEGKLLTILMTILTMITCWS